MNGKQRRYTLDTEQNEAELVSMVTENPWSLLKTFLVCLLACLISTTLVVLVVYFVHFGRPTSNTTIIIQPDGKSSQVTFTPASTPSAASSPPPAASTPSAASSPPPGSQSTPPSTPVTSQSSSTTAAPSTLESTKTTTVDHEVIIDYDK
ncbi:dynactin-associated protein-like [Oryctolagus cuniculus]|uniref:dynactin-associated protein-like n=1 Tax=Oryctolagus cuniculus TaxID=9986 RepID=UPI0007EE45DF|nr:dynactin-associated protein-like [Oryctolagus cuniculus]